MLVTLFSDALSSLGHRLVGGSRAASKSKRAPIPRRFRFLSFALLFLGCFVCNPFMFPQLMIGARLHGHANDFQGAAIRKGTVELVNTKTPGYIVTEAQYTLALDNEGNFTADNIASSTYVAVLYVDGKLVDYIRDVNVTPNSDTLIDFDMRRAEFLARMSPQRKKTNEAYLQQLKKYNTDKEVAALQNANLNSLLSQARIKVREADFPAAVLLMNKALTSRPDTPVFWMTLADAQYGAKQYDLAIGAYRRTITLATVPAYRELLASAQNNLGSALAASGNPSGAIDSFAAAAATDPQAAFTYYYNEAVVFSDLSRTDEALGAVNKVISLNPRWGVAYYLRGTILLRQSPDDPQTHKLHVSKECIDSYKRYLSLDSDGSHVSEVRAILAALGEH